jgi:hypothetical protein
MKPLSILWIMLTLLSGCGPTEYTSVPKPAAPIVLDAPVEFTVYQRSTIPLPGSNEKVVITIDDITRGQVMATILWQNGTPIAPTRSVHKKDVVTFTVSNHTYKIKLEQLTNVLVGEDSAVFQLWPATIEMDKVPSQSGNIETLILSLRQLVGARFIRNGQEHTPDEAIVHMRKKWEWKKSKIKTADDFIRIVGSKSSTSGKPYMIRFSDGTEMKSEEWFSKQLELMKSLPSQRMDSDK